MKNLRSSLTQSRRPLACSLLIAAALVGCTDGKSPMRPDNRPALNNSERYSVIAASASSVAPDAQQRDAQERATIDQIVGHLPVQFQMRGRAMLEDRNAVYAFQSSSDPEIARLLGVLTAIRKAASANQESQAAKDREADVERTKNLVRVTVVLAPPSALPTGRAAVIRRPGDGGKPLLLLREQDATAADLAAGLAAAARLAQKFGAEPANEVRVVIKSARAGNSKSAVTDRYVETLRSSLLQTIPGVGTVHTMDMMTKAPASPAP